MFFPAARRRFAALLITVFLAWAHPGCSNGQGESFLEKGQGVEQARPAMIVAHRGVNKFAPENTMPAIELAIRMGLDYVEIDVRTSRDGQMVLMHNEVVDGTTDGSGLVRDLTAGQIRDLDAGSWFSEEFAGTRVPLLEEALETMRGRIGAYVDVKDADPSRLLEVLRRTGMLGASVLYADPLTHLAMRGLDPDAKVMPEVGDNDFLFEFMLFLLHPGVVAVSWGNPTGPFIDRIQAEGIQVFMDVLGETDTPEGMRAALDLGVDAMQTDNPDILLEVMREWAANQPAGAGFRGGKAPGGS